MNRILSFVATLCLLHVAQAQFVYPRMEDHDHEPGVYTEDPFITHYRKEFFAVFQGDVPRFKKAYGEIQAMVAKNPRDARALVWLGNGQTIEAGMLKLKGKKPEAEALLKTSRVTMDRAVSLKPKDPNIYMMQAATLYIQGQYWPESLITQAAWRELRDDCLRFIKYLGPKMARASTHVRDETYGELGIAYLKLGQKDQAKSAFEKIIQFDPKSEYAVRAHREITKLRLKS